MTRLQILTLIKKFQSIIKELFVRCRKLSLIRCRNISLVFITQFFVAKGVKLYSTHDLIIKVHNKNELQEITINYPAGIYYKDFMKNSQKMYY